VAGMKRLADASDFQSLARSSELDARTALYVRVRKPGVASFSVYRIPVSVSSQAAMSTTPKGIRRGLEPCG
jgi:hypothetical protein